MRANKGPKQGQPQPGGGPAKRKEKAAKGQGEAHHNAPRRPARSNRPGRTSTRTDARDPGVASSDPQGEVSASTGNSPGAPAQSPVEQRTVRETGRVSDRFHTRQPPQRTQPETGAGGTRQGQPHRGAPKGYDAERAQRPCLGGGQRQAQLARFSAGLRVPRAASQQSRGPSPWDGERHHGVGKADRSTESNRTERGAAHHAGPRGTPERHAAGHNRGTRTGAKPQRPPGATNPESAHNTHRTTAQEQVHSNTSCCLDGRVRARRVPSPYRLRTAAVRMDECAPGGYQAPTGYEQPPSGWTSERPAATPRPRNTTRTTRSTAHRASTPVYKSQAAQDTVHATQPSKRAHR